MTHSPFWTHEQTAAYIGKKAGCHIDTLKRWADKFAPKAYLGNGVWLPAAVRKGAKKQVA